MEKVEDVTTENREFEETISNSGEIGEIGNRSRSEGGITGTEGGSTGTDNGNRNENGGTKRRGRKPKSESGRNSSSDETGTEKKETVLNFDVSETEPVKKERKKRTSKKNTEEVQQTALLIIMIFDGIATTFIGPKAALQQTELEFIEPALVRILTRLSPSTIETVEKYTDPLMLLFGLSIWGIRVIQLTEKPKVEQKKKTTLKPEVIETAEPTEYNNGYGASLDIISQIGGFE